jgi:hypothetical protein
MLSQWLRTALRLGRIDIDPFIPFSINNRISINVSSLQMATLAKPEQIQSQPAWAQGANC